MLGSTGRLRARSAPTAADSEVSLPLVAIVPAPVALKPNGDTSVNTGSQPAFSPRMPSLTTALDQLGIHPLTKRPGVDRGGLAVTRAPQQ